MWADPQMAQQEGSFCLLRGHGGDPFLLSLQAVAEWKGRPLSGLQWLWDMDIIDLYAEWRMTQNHNNKYAYGRYFSASGGQRRSVPPKLNKKLQRGERQQADLSKPRRMCRQLGFNLDQQNKEAMRNLILSAPSQFAPPRGESRNPEVLSRRHQVSPPDLGAVGKGDLHEPPH